MKNESYEAAARELMNMLPSDMNLITIVAGAERDQEGMKIAESITRKFARHGHSRKIKRADNQMMIVEGTPFSERLSFVADKVDIRTFSYIPSGESQFEYSEQLRVMQEEVVRHMVGEKGVMIAFPKGICPKMIVPMAEIETQKYRCWGAVAMAVKLGITALVFASGGRDVRRFMGPMETRSKVLGEGDWGAWILVKAIPEDMNQEVVQILKQWGESEDAWIEGVASRPNWASQN